MSSTKLQQWIIEQIKDEQWGSHHKIKIWSKESNSYKEADWLWKYANRKAIIIEDKEEKDVSLEKAQKQVKRYEKLLKTQGYEDIITIAIKDEGNCKKLICERNGNNIKNNKLL